MATTVSLLVARPMINVVGVKNMITLGTLSIGVKLTFYSLIK